MKASEHTCQVIIDKAGITGWRLGQSRVFLRYFHEEKLQLLLKEMEDKTILIQKVYRGYSARKRSVKLTLCTAHINTTKAPDNLCIPPELIHCFGIAYVSGGEAKLI